MYLGKPLSGWCVSLQEEQMSPDLRQDLDDFMAFCTKRSWQQQHEPIAPITAEKYTHHLRCRLTISQR